jgi:NTE family protein
MDNGVFMAITVNGEQKRIGLALSGGGFRATGFHLGVFRKLLELKLLWKVDLLSCVSGGSIAGAFLASRWGDDSALDDLEQLLTSTSIDIRTALGGFFNPFETRTDALSGAYEKYFFKKLTLGDLSTGPRLYLNATNLATGNLFFFVTGGNGKSEIGEHELGQVEAPDFKLADAVAASSAFPPVYPPLKLDDDWFPNREVEYVALTDGGVYDNLGVNPLLRRKRNKIDYAIVSDAGKPFDIDEDPTESSIMVLKASIGILMEQVRGQQLNRLRLEHEAGGSPIPAFFSIDSKEGGERYNDWRKASSISTRLRKLEPHELKVLIRHGGALVESRINKYMKDILQ